MIDDIRPRGTVQVKCSRCDWEFWVEALDPRLPDGPFVCPTCKGGPFLGVKDFTEAK